MAKAGYFNYCLNIYWSLSVEEIFYLAFPLICIFLKKLRFIVPVLLAFIILGPVYRSLHQSDEIIALYAYFSCFDAIAIGCLAAIIAHYHPLRLGKIIQYSAGLAALAIYLYANIMSNVVFGVSLMAISVAILLLSVSSISEKEKKETSFFSGLISWFGRHSYELYLFHIIVLALMKTIVAPQELGNYSKLLWMMVFFTASTMLAGVIAKYYSQPMNKKLREYFFSYKTAAIDH